MTATGSMKQPISSTNAPTSSMITVALPEDINMMPNAKIGHIGMYRDEETFKPNRYFFKVPKNIESKE
ncbi:MAG: hypothetical protein IKM82_07430, partial [Oscillospiraceae bacterium]|nr:hypothetical protein [Oscillospiraceae bacterium]